MMPRVNYDRLVGDGVYKDAYPDMELLKEFVINGKTKEMKSMEESEMQSWYHSTTGRRHSTTSGETVRRTFCRTASGS